MPLAIPHPPFFCGRAGQYCDLNHASFRADSIIVRIMDGYRRELGINPIFCGAKYGFFV
jgi:hypothetical protein